MPELSSSHDLHLDLSIDLNSDPETVDFTYLQDSLCALTHTFVSNASLRDWLMPNFSTTSTTDLTSLPACRDAPCNETNLQFWDYNFFLIRSIKFSILYHFLELFIPQETTTQ